MEIFKGLCLSSEFRDWSLPNNHQWGLFFFKMERARLCAISVLLAEAKKRLPKESLLQSLTASILFCFKYVEILQNSSENSDKR